MWAICGSTEHLIEVDRNTGALKLERHCAEGDCYSIQKYFLHFIMLLLGLYCELSYCLLLFKISVGKCV